MNVDIVKYHKSSGTHYPYSIIIPSWNNQPYLEFCIRSLQNNSAHQGQIIVLVNEGADDTLSYLETLHDVDYIHARENIGICYGVNLARSLVKSDYLIYMNDDMYVLPQWDQFMFDEISKIDTKLFMVSATMIEPHDTGNPSVVVRDFGDSIQDFQEAELLAHQSKLIRKDWQGSTWPPMVMHVDVWDAVGGFSSEFSPGMYSDPDLAKKCHDLGVRHFQGVGRSLVYHFGSKSTKRIRKNQGRKTFILKWGITARTFNRDILGLGKDFSGPVSDVKLSFVARVINAIKRIRYSFKDL